MNSKKARAMGRIMCPEGHDEEAENKIREFFSPESVKKRNYDYDNDQEFFAPKNVKKRSLDYNNDRRGAIKAQKARKNKEPTK